MEAAARHRLRALEEQVGKRACGEQLRVGTHAHDAGALGTVGGDRPALLTIDLRPNGRPRGGYAVPPSTAWVPDGLRQRRLLSSTLVDRSQSQGSLSTTVKEGSEA